MHENCNFSLKKFIQLSVDEQNFFYDCDSIGCALSSSAGRDSVDPIDIFFMLSSTVSVLGFHEN